jgi:hypothetical protein
MADSIRSVPSSGGYIEGPIIDDSTYGDVFYDGGQYNDGHYEESFSAGVACDSLTCGGGNCGGCGGIGCGSAASCDSPGGGCDSGCGRCAGRGGRSGWLPCLTLCAPRNGWVSAEYLNWSQRGMFLPALATQNAGGIGVAPNLGTAGTQIIYGNNNDFVDGSLNGFRLGFGFFLDHCHEWSIAADYFGFDAVTDSALFLPDPSVSLGRPINNVANMGLPAAELVNFNGINIDGNPVNITGTLGIDVRSELQSGGFQLRRFLVCRDGCGDTVFMNLPSAYRSRIDLGIGYRYTQLDEGLGITERLAAVGSPAGSFINVFDNFDTQTQFNGVDFGIFYTRHRGLWSIDLQGRFGIGTNQQQVDINGVTQSRLGNGVTNNDQGGLLALDSNIGSFSRDRFSILPEFRATLGYKITPRLRATVGYTFLYWSNVVRPGDQIDLDVNRNQVPNPGINPVVPTSPRFSFNETDYWAQGISVGGEYRW